MSNRALLAQCEMISLESDSGTNAVVRAVKRLPDYFECAKSAMSKSVLTPIQQLFQSSDNDWYKKKLSTLSYIELQTIEVACPMGFKGDYVKYTKDLLTAVEMAGAVLSKNLIPYSEWLEGKLGDPSTLASLTTAKVQGLETLKVEDQIKHLQTFFVPDGRENATTQYQHLVRRNADWMEISERMRKIETIMSESYHKAMMEGTQRLTNNLDQLLHRIETDPTAYKLSNATVKTLAEITFESARAVEFYALIRFKVRELETAMTDMREKLDHLK